MYDCFELSNKLECLVKKQKQNKAQRLKFGVTKKKKKFYCAKKLNQNTVTIRLPAGKTAVLHPNLY